jgi:pyruvate dehydrogenase E1 component
MKEKDNYDLENQEWLDSLDYVIKNSDPDRVRDLLSLLEYHAHKKGITFRCPGNTPYINTITPDNEMPFPGSIEIERRIKSLVRWNAMAMVVRANLESEGIGGHISTYASSATLYEVGFNHFFRGARTEYCRYYIFPGACQPGNLCPFICRRKADGKGSSNFRQELRPDGGLPSYPHPRLMPEYWQFPTVSMGLGPIMAIYQARLNKYLEDRGLKEKTIRKYGLLLATVKWMNLNRWEQSQ